MLGELTSPHRRSRQSLTDLAPLVRVVVLGGHGQQLTSPQPDCQVPGLQGSHRPPPPTSHLNTVPGGQASSTRHDLRCSTVLALTNIFTPRPLNK